MAPPRLHSWALLLLLMALSALAAPTIDVEEEGGKLPCHKNSRRKSTLKALKETPFSGLFAELRNSTVFEASAVARVRGKFYVVFDNAMSVGFLDERFQFRDPQNKLIGDWEPESQFEGIAYMPESDTFLLLHEALPDKEEVGAFKPFIQHVKIKPDMSDYETIETCKVEFHLTHENKGFESIQYLFTPNGAYLLGMCEGNFCVGGSEGKKPGNGRIVVSQLKTTKEGGCVWDPMKVINIPESAYFKDYAGMAYNYDTRKLAILSQEEAAIWVGDFHGDKLEFASQEGQVFHLPRDNHCEIVYCNAEGITWIDHYRIVIASDKAKSYQPFWCDTKDQSIHLFAMPRAWDPYATAEESAARMAAEEAAE
ncbi:hypothetical protein CHLNCDRAFT_57598, partial [Chlorella variabilis]